MSNFNTIDFYKSDSSDLYQLLPFKFIRLNDDEILLTNLVGEFHVINESILRSLVTHDLKSSHPDYIDLRSKHFLFDKKTQIAKNLLSIKYRTKFSRLSEFTSLHMFVVSLRCEHSCPYCQVSRQSDDKIKFDMSAVIASKSLELVFKSPSKNIKIEFQGGESLLNFELIKHIVISARNMNADKNLAFVIATNLAVITDEILDFCLVHDIHISTSLDGPEFLHNKNRPRPGKNSYEKTIEGIKLARDKLGFDKVNALMTTTEASLNYVKEIIDEYLSLNFTGIFLRPLSPYGFAVKTKKFSEYTAERWFEFYVEGLEYIIDLNKQGIIFKEFYTSMILSKIFTFRDPGYVDLMSPSGIGISGVVYNYDGSVFASDESRMLAEMGDDKFKLGNVLTDSYEDIFLSDALLDPLEESFAYSAPMCNDCAFESYCGAEPVYHYAVHNDFIGRKPESDFCYRNMNVIKHLFSRMSADPFVKDLFMKWAQ